jgi:hypothetical protein
LLPGQASMYPPPSCPAMGDEVDWELFEKR